MGDMNQFHADLTKFANMTRETMGQLQRAAAFAIMRDVVQNSPIDTGRFMSSWMVGIGVRSEAVAPEKSQSRAAAAAESESRLSILTPESVKGTEPIILSNNLPYAERLAHGHSGQAANGWVDAAVLREQRRLESLKG